MGNIDIQEDENLSGEERKSTSNKPKETTVWAKLIVIVFSVLGIFLGYQIYKGGGNSLSRFSLNIPKLDLSNIPNPTPTINSDTTKEIVLTNKNNGETINVRKNDQIIINLRLNRNADNKISISNLNILAEDQPLKFESKSDLFKATMKVIGEGQSLVEINESLNCSGTQKCSQSLPIFKVKISTTNN